MSTTIDSLINKLNIYDNSFKHLFINFPDKDTMIRLSKINNYKNYISEEKEKKILDFINKNKILNEPSASFYHCRMLQIVTKYDSELYNMYNFSSLMTLLCSIFYSKIFINALLNGKYITKQNELKAFFFSSFLFVGGSLFLVYKNKNNIDRFLNEKYSAIYAKLKMHSK